MVDCDTYEYKAQDEGARGSFDWEFHYKRLPRVRIVCVGRGFYAFYRLMKRNRDMIRANRLIVLLWLVVILQLVRNGFGNWVCILDSYF